MKKNLVFSLGVAFAALFGACSDDAPAPAVNQGPLVSMTVSLDPIQTKGTGVISGESLDNGVSIGVFVVDGTGSTYDSQSYNNIKYTSFTPDATQIWSGADILLSATAGKAYAYYPYADGTAITAIALNVANNDDVLYDASGVTVTNASPMATFQLNHALSLVTVDIVRNTYTGTGSVSAFSLKAKKASATGTLDATTGTISGFGGYNAYIDDPLLTTPVTIPSADTRKITRQMMIVPGGSDEAADQVTFKVVMDGQTFTAQSTEAVTFLPNKHYKFSLNMNSTGMVLSQVTVEGWTSGNGDGETLTPVIETP